MIFSPTLLSYTVDEARKHLEIQGRESDTPIWFELQASYKGGEQDAQRLCSDISPIPAWGWPVLDNEASVTTLKSALKKLSTKGELTELTLAALQAGYTPQTVMDFFNCEINPSEPTQPPLIFRWKITNMAEVIETIKQNEQHGDPQKRSVIITSVDEQLSLDDRLNKHQQYAMDGTGTILWSGTMVYDYPSPTPTDIETAAIQEIFYTGRQKMVLVLSGDTVDSGQSRALIKNVHRIATLLFGKK